MNKLTRQKIIVRRRQIAKLDAVVLQIKSLIAKRELSILSFSNNKKLYDYTISLRDCSIRKLSDIKNKISKLNSEIDNFIECNAPYAKNWIVDDFQNDGVAEPTAGDAKNIAAAAADDIVERAKLWGEKYGITDFVTQVETSDGPVDVINLHRQKKVDVQTTGDLWPSFFASMVEQSGQDLAERRAWLEELFASSDPEMQRVIGILQTKGMLHMVITESLTLRGKVLPVSDDPADHAEGRASLEKLEAVDAKAYERKFGV